MKPTARLRHFLLGTAFLATASSLQAQTNYTWDGDTDASFSTAGNWSPSVAPTGGTSNSRINVNNGANNQLTYTATQETTIYSGGAGRALVIASGANGSMTITGGTFDSRQTDNDLMVNGQFVGSLTMNGGNYINTNGGGNIFHLGFNAGAAAGAQATLNMQSGNFTTGILQFGQSAGLNAGGLVSVANLDGGILTANEIREGAAAGTNVGLATSTINFNGGTLRAGATNASFLSTGSVDNAVVQGNGAIIDTNTFNVTIGKALTAGTGSGGLTKQGAGTLTLSGGNSYTGQTKIDVGTLGIGNNTALGTTAGNTVVASGATAYGTAPLSALAEAFNISGTGVGGVGAIRIGGGGITNMTGAVILAGNATIGTDGGVTLTLSGGIDTAGNTLTLAPTGTAFDITTVGISGSDGSIITSGTVSLNVASSYGGGTTVSSGTLNIGNAAALGSTSGQLTVNGGTLNMAGNSITVGNLTGSGGVISGTSGTRLLTIGQGNTGGGDFQGQINNGAGGTTALTKTGNGTITLSGANGYTGDTNVSGGKLVVAGSIAASAVTVSGAGTILATDAAASFGGTLAVQNGAILAAGDAGAAGTATVTGATTFDNGSIFSWDISANGLSYDKLVSAGSLTDGGLAGGSEFRVVVADTGFVEGFWNSTQTWTNIFTTDGTAAIGNWADIFTTVSVVNSTFTPLDTSAKGSFSTAGNTLTWTAVPEPTSALAGLLLAAGLLRRRRN